MGESKVRIIMEWSGYAIAVIGFIAGVATLVYASTVDESEVVELSRQGGLLIVGMLFLSLAMVVSLTVNNIRLRGAAEEKVK